MNCQNCQHILKEGAKFCGSCGAQVDTDTEKTTTQETVVKDPVKKSILDRTVTIGGWIVGFVIGKFLGLVFFLFLGAYLLGQWFPKWYLKREKINVTLVKWIVWSNLITWLLPPLGITTGLAALNFGNHFPGSKKTFKTVAVIGIILSLLNALSGVLLNI